MTPLARAFWAVYPPAAVCDAAAERLGALAPVEGLRWMPRDQWHVTLRFCGRVPDVDALVDAVTGTCAAMPPVVGLELVPAGGFPRPGRGSALWLGVGPAGAVDALGAVAAAVEAGCVAAGLPPDGRPFRPHVTVARWSRARDLRARVAEIGDGPIGGAWTVDHLRLMASDLRPPGAVHTEVARICLSG